MHIKELMLVMVLKINVKLKVAVAHNRHAWFLGCATPNSSSADINFATLICAKCLKKIFAFVFMAEVKTNIGECCNVPSVKVTARSYHHRQPRAFQKPCWNCHSVSTGQVLPHQIPLQFKKTKH